MSDHPEPQRRPVYVKNLRDEFAAAALPALVARHRADVAWSEIAPRAYEIADAMMRERERTPA